MEFHGTAPPPIPPVARARLAVPLEPPVWGMAFLVPAGGREHEGLSFLLRVHSVHAVSCAACAAAARSLGVGRPRRCGHQSHRNVCCVFLSVCFWQKPVYICILNICTEFWKIFSLVAKSGFFTKEIPWKTSGCVFIPGGQSAWG